MNRKKKLYIYVLLAHSINEGQSCFNQKHLFNSINTLYMKMNFHPDPWSSHLVVVAERMPDEPPGCPLQKDVAPQVEHPIGCQIFSKILHASDASLVAGRTQASLARITKLSTTLANNIYIYISKQCYLNSFIFWMWYHKSFKLLSRWVTHCGPLLS